MSIHDNARALPKGKRPVIFSEDLAMKLINELDVERLARAICGCRPPELPADYRDDMFVDDECKGFAERVAAEYARLGEEQS